MPHNIDTSPYSPRTSRRHYRPSDSSSIIGETSEVLIYKNPCDEIFIQDKKSGTTIRLNACPDLNGGLQFTSDGRVEPFRVSNMIGYRISPR